MDLHVDGITHYFEGAIRPVHVYAKEVIKSAARDLGGEDFVLGCTDAGRAKWVESLAHELGVEVGFVYKRRDADGDVKVVGVSAHVAEKRVVIYDDMIRSGSSLLGAAQAYVDAGAIQVSAITTHGLFPDDSLARVAGSGLLDRLVCTNTHPRAVAGAGADLEVRSVAPIFVEQLRRQP
jgi:ribose-phosphate pyrophosphokinase